MPNFSFTYSNEQKFGWSLKKSPSPHNAVTLGIPSKKYTFCMSTVLTLNKKDRLARGHV